MLVRYTTLLGSILVAVALFAVLTGVPEEAGGVIVHVELARAEHPVPEGLGSWDGVDPSAATGDRYGWAPTGWVLVERTDGSIVRARNDFDGATYMARVSILRSRTGRWLVTGVERGGDGDDEPAEGDLMIADGELLEVSGDGAMPAAPDESGETGDVDPHGDVSPPTSDGDVADPQDSGVTDGYAYLNQPTSP